MPPDAPTRVLIVGATSAIAEETARLYAARGARLFLVARHPERLAAVAADLGVRGAGEIRTAQLDVTAHHQADGVVGAAWTAFSGLDVALIAHGVLPDQAGCEASAEEALRAIDVNFSSVIALLTPLANRFEQSRGGCIAVISSVAGDRGRQSNYVYGSAKGGLDRFLQGLRNRLYRAGVAVVTIKPGFVDTPMTAALPKNSLYASARQVGRGVYRAIEARRSVVYLPWFWRPIMLLIKLLPESVFKRLRL